MKYTMVAVVGFLLLGLVSCTRSEMEKEASSSREFTQEEYEALGKRIAKKINARSYDTLNRVLDLKYILEKISQRIASPELANEFSTPLAQQEFKKNFTWARQVALDVAQNHGQYEFVRFHRKKNVPHLLLRLTSDSGFDYHDYEVRTIADSLRFTDVYVYTSGEYISYTLQDVVTRIVTEQQQNKLSRTHHDLDDYRSKTVAMKQKIEEKDFAGALQVYNSFPALTRKSKALMLYKLNITSNMDMSLYQQTVSEYKKLFPNDPSLSMLSLNTYFAQGDYASTLQYLNKLDTIVGGDSYLNLFRSTLYYMMGEKDKAMGLIDAYIKAKPKDTNGYWKKFELYMLEEKNEDAIEVLNEIDRKTMYSRRMITYYVETKYPDFAVFSSFLDWKAKWIKRYQEKNSWKLPKKP